MRVAVVLANCPTDPSSELLIRRLQNDDDASKKDEKRSGEEWGKTMNRLLHKIISLTTI